MNAIAERQMMPWVLTVYDELVRPVDDRLVAVTRQVPHHNLVAFSDLLAADLPILQRRAAHMGQRCLPADDLWHHASDEPRIVIQFQIRVRVLVQRSEEHTSELQSLMRISSALLCLKKKKDHT